MEVLMDTKILKEILDVLTYILFGVSMILGILIGRLFRGK